MSALLQLAERCEKATGPDYRLDADIARAVGWKYRLREATNTWQWHHPTNDHHIQSAPPAFTASLDAAMQLVPEGWTRTVKWSVENEGYALVYDPSAPDDSSIYALGKTAALALCAAALRARAAS
jgi:hypothetical protein